MTFNSNITGAFQTNSGVGSHTLEVDDITLDSGLTGSVQLSGRYVIGADNTVVTNNSATIAKWEAHIMTASTGQVQLRNGDFQTTTGSANNSIWTGGTLIDDALWNINTVNAGGQTTNFGSGGLVFGDVNSIANATLQITNLRAGTTTNLANAITVNSSDAVLDIDQAGNFNVNSDITLVAGSNLRVDNTGVTFFNGLISGTGDVELGSGPSIVVVNNSNTFTGNVTLNNTTQIRATDGLGNAANEVAVNHTFRLFVPNADGTVVLGNNLNISPVAGNIGVQAPAGLHATGTLNGDLRLNEQMETLTLVGTTNGTQNLTLNLNGAILDFATSATNVVISGAGVFDSSATFNLGGANIYGGTTTVDAPAAGSLFVNLDGSISNSNLTIGAGAEFAGSGTMFFNLDGITSDLTIVNGTLDITGLTLDFQEIGLGATENSYLVADYTAGSLVGAAFANVLNTPTGYSLDYNFGTGDQIALVIPEASHFGLLGGLSLIIFAAIRRRRK